MNLLMRFFLALVCSMTGLLIGPAHGQSGIVDKRVTVQPILVCDNSGGNCPVVPVHLLEGPTDRIWMQPGIDVAYLPTVQINNTGFQNIADAAEATSLFETPGNGQHADPLVLNLWIVKDITGAFGRADTGGNGAVIAETVFTFNGGDGRLDTIAHELGHNLALDHFSWGSGGTTNLMTAAGRISPANLCEIMPGTQRLDQLNDAQIAVSRSSQFARALVPPVTNAAPVLSMENEGNLTTTSLASCCYQLLSAPDADANWTPIGVPTPGTSTNLQWLIDFGEPRGYFKVRVE
jgi:hypothetical protein